MFVLVLWYLTKPISFLFQMPSWFSSYPRQTFLCALAQNFYKVQYMQKLQKFLHQVMLPTKTRMNMYRTIYQKILLMYQFPHLTVLMKLPYRSWNAMSGVEQEVYGESMAKDIVKLSYQHFRIWNNRWDWQNPLGTRKEQMFRQQYDLHKMQALKTVGGTTKCTNRSGTLKMHSSIFTIHPFRLQSEMNDAVDA